MPQRPQDAGDTPAQPGTFFFRHTTDESGDPAGGEVLHPVDVVAVRWHDRSGNWNGCCGPDGRPPLNLLCGGCAVAVATLRADCWTGIEVEFVSDAVVRTGDDAALDLDGPTHPRWFAELRDDPVARALDG